LNDNHLPVLCEETINLVTAVLEDEAERPAVFVDATFGRGGHSRALLARLGRHDRVIAIDRDQAALAAAQTLTREEPRLSFHHARFGELIRVLDSEGVEQVDGVIMDLGVSSPQLEDPDRGFSFRGDGPLDMRMDQTTGETAAQWLNAADQAEIARVIRTFGEERHAGRIAAAIVRARPLSGTRQLADIVRGAVPRRGPGRSDEATRTFQAIRMQVNGELEEVICGIEEAFARLRPGGRLAVISFHSLEDRTVKRVFRRLARGRDLPRNLPVRAAEAAPAGRVVAGPVRAGAQELERNPRARSATLRVLERAA
jgi:16S rRNA (cytosine1402-N4)-methyltransferase